MARTTIRKPVAPATLANKTKKKDTMFQSVTQKRVSHKRMRASHATFGNRVSACDKTRIQPTTAIKFGSLLTFMVPTKPYANRTEPATSEEQTTKTAPCFNRLHKKRLLVRQMNSFFATFGNRISVCGLIHIQPSDRVQSVRPTHLIGGETRAVP